MTTEDVPGWEGSVGPGPRDYGKSHVYARDVLSGAGNCVCGGPLTDVRHVQAAPGVPIPAKLQLHPPRHLTPEVTPRGFQHLPAIPSTHGGEITAYESSSAMQASVWVKIHETMPGSEERKAVVHLTVEDAAKLRDQLDWLIENHYQFR